MIEREQSFEPKRWPARTARQLGDAALRVAHPEGWLRQTATRMAAPERWWARRQDEAAIFMESRKGQPKVLLLPTADHPLLGGLYPNQRFKARLMAARDRAQVLQKQGTQVEIYVPGSRHSYRGYNDDIPLATAGKIFLRNNGLPQEIVVHGDLLNQKYKGDDGVYNCGDEAFVATSHFKDDPTFERLEVLCGPEQITRWELNAIAQGVLPEFRPVGDPDPAKEDSLLLDYYTVRCDPTWQGRASVMGAVARRQRRPRA